MGPPGNRGSWGPLCPCPNSKKPIKKGTRGISLYKICSLDELKNKCCVIVNVQFCVTRNQGWTENSWGPQAIGDHGAPVSLPRRKKAYEKGTRGIYWGPLLTPGPRAVPEFPNNQSAPA
ncbi:unnamed protein product, partial [Staurois parvus]